jgi:hypothetical protein
MPDQQILNAISVAGSVLSLIGVWITLLQMRRTRRAAEAAEKASQRAQQAIARNVLLVDVTACLSQLDAIKTMIRAKRYDAGLLRVGDLAAALAQLRNVGSSEPAKQLPYKKALTQLGILRDLLEQRLQDEQVPVNPVQVNSVLSDISSSLNTWIGGAKYLPNEESKDG